MKYKHPRKSLKDITEIARKKPINRKPQTTHPTKVRLQPWAPGCLQVFPGDTLAPVKLVINNTPEFFLWHTSNTNLHSEFNFALQLLSDLEISLPKFQLIEVAQKYAQSIREQVQQYREVAGARHSYQGLTGEHLVPLQFSGQGFQWDLACPDNSPEYFARVLCQDMELPESGYPNIAFKLRNALKSHKTRLANTLNEAMDGLPVIDAEIKNIPGLDVLELESSIQEIIPGIPFKRDNK
jgi:SNF5 / SMARCB1 / INI1